MGDVEADVKSRILLAAKRLFAEYGYEGTSVRQICEAASANVALVSYHFGGKEQLFHALLVKFFPLSRMKELQAYQGHPIGGLEYFIEEICRYQKQEPEMIRILQLEITLNTPRMKELQMHVLPFWGALKQILQEGKELGVFHFDCLSRTTNFIIGMMLFNQKETYWKPLFEGDDEHHTLTYEQEFIQFVKRALGVAA